MALIRGSHGFVVERGRTSAASWLNTMTSAGGAIGWRGHVWRAGLYSARTWRIIVGYYGRIAYYITMAYWAWANSGVAVGRGGCGGMGRILLAVAAGVALWRRPGWRNGRWHRFWRRVGGGVRMAIGGVLWCIGRVTSGGVLLTGQTAAGG